MTTDKKRFLGSYLLQQAKINRLYEMMAANPEQKETYLKKIEDCKKVRQKIEEGIAAVEDDILKEVLYQKYMCGKTLQQIAFSLNYSKRHVERLHIAALDSFKL